VFFACAHPAVTPPLRVDRNKMDAGLAASALGPGGVESSPTDMLIAAIKTANTSAALSLVAQFPQAAHGIDTQDGATPLHWAALFGNMEVIENLAGEGAKLDVSIETSGMQPVHWASTQGRVDVVKFLLARGIDLNSTDIKKTTPLVIAAQYDHSVLVFYLVKEGADISLLDDCSDSALHWAAYKGNIHTTALLHYLGLPADAADSYGSTPLHLAAARNAPHVIEYLIDESASDTERLVALKDNKGRTPLDIARERANPLAVRLLQRASPSLRTRLVNMMMGSDGSKVLFYFYVTNSAMCYVVYWLVIAPAVGTAMQHYVYAAAIVLMQLTYLQIHTADPGTIDTGPKGRKAYEDALQVAAEGSLSDASSMPALCHTCRIVKPLRSKHCSTLKRCVPMFDHYCPYIGNTIGGGNYVYFVRFIFFGFVNVGLSVVGALQFLFSVNMRSAGMWMYLFDYSAVLLMAVLMNQFHLSLILRNLTTNEDMNKQRYSYLRDDMNKYHNPFSNGLWGNVREFLGRRDAVLANPYVHSELFEHLQREKPADVEMAETGSCADGEETDHLAPHQGHSHSHHHGHSHAHG